MDKANRKSVAVAKRMHLEDPGTLESVKVPDGYKTNWRGGRVGCIADDLVPVVAWMQNNGELPVGLQWLCHCDDENVWYVSRVDDEPKEVPID